MRLRLLPHTRTVWFTVGHFTIYYTVTCVGSVRLVTGLRLLRCVTDTHSLLRLRSGYGCWLPHSYGCSHFLHTHVLATTPLPTRLPARLPPFWLFRYLHYTFDRFVVRPLTYHVCAFTHPVCVTRFGLTTVTTCITCTFTVIYTFCTLLPALFIPAGCALPAVPFTGSLHVPYYYTDSGCYHTTQFVTRLHVYMVHTRLRFPVTAFVYYIYLPTYHVDVFLRIPYTRILPHTFVPTVTLPGPHVGYVLPLTTFTPLGSTHYTVITVTTFVARYVADLRDIRLGRLVYYMPV